MVMAGGRWNCIGVGGKPPWRIFSMGIGSGGGRMTCGYTTGGAEVRHRLLRDLRLHHVGGRPTHASDQARPGAAGPWRPLHQQRGGRPGPRECHWRPWHGTRWARAGPRRSWRRLGARGGGSGAASTLGGGALGATRSVEQRSSGCRGSVNSEHNRELEAGVWWCQFGAKETEAALSRVRRH